MDKRTFGLHLVPISLEGYKNIILVGNSVNVRPSVAVVDDDPRIRALIAEELSDEGFEASICSSGPELLDLITHKTIDLVLLDLMMPGMDGLECLRQLNSQDFAGSVVIVSAFSDDTKRREALAAGAKQYIVKPDLFDLLPELIDQYLRVE